MLVSYDDLLDVAEELGLYVTENVPLIGIRGLIFGREILLRDGLTLAEKTVVLAEEITHYLTNRGDITKNWKEELRCHKNLVTGNISIFELLEAIISCGDDATYYSVAEELDISERFLREVIEIYSQLPIRPFEYKNHYISFNPLRIINLDEYYWRDAK